MNKTTEKIPTWSLGYIINGDATALTDDEVLTIDRWMKQWVDIEAAKAELQGSKTSMSFGENYIYGTSPRRPTRSRQWWHRPCSLPCSAGT